MGAGNGRKVKKGSLICITVLMLSLIFSMFGLTMQTFTYASDTFTQDGFILAAANEENNVAVNAQYYFNKDVSYLKKTDGTIDFETINGESVSVESNNFIHFTDLSMKSFEKSVLLDTDTLHNDNLSYYLIPSGSILERRNNAYAVNNGVEVLNLSNFIWKLSADRYTVVSNTIKLVVEEDSFQTFDNFLQLEYMEDGVVHLVNQDGTYSTVSSSTYLELENGIRLYLGSKNVSDSEGILVNLGQIIVNSDDDVESNPDDYFTIEVDRTPRIIVEANDGADGENGEIGKTGKAGENGENGEDGEDGEIGKTGKAGEAGKNGENGENGENGTNGKNGQQGNQGAAGASGKGGTGGEAGNDGENYDVSYTEETMPEFTVTITPSSFGMSANIKYVELDCDVDEDSDSTYISIIETLTGEEVWRWHPTSDYMKSTGFEANCNILKQNTNYTFAITCAYTPYATNKEVKQTVLTKYFTTKSSGFELSVKYTTENQIYAELTKVSDDGTKSLSINCYAENKEDYLTYLIPTAAEYIDNNFNKTSGIFTIPNEMKIGDSIEFMCSQGPIERNTTYYLRICNVEVTGVSDDVLQCITDAFPFVKAKTLKKAPTIGKPEVTVDERTNSFIITPTEVSDPDSGIISYTYEIYKAENITVSSEGSIEFTSSPVFSAVQSQAGEMSVTIDDVKIKRGEEYYARIIAKFDNNEVYVNYASPLSDKFSAGESVWPQLINSIEEDYATASTVEGTLTINDEHKTIDAFYGFDIYYKYDGLVDGKEVSGDIQIAQDAIDYGKQTGRYEIDYFLSGLKDEGNYTIYVYAGLVTVNGKAYSKVLVGTASFNTTSYSSLKLLSENDESDTTHNFAVRVSFAPSNAAAEAALSSKQTYNDDAKAQGLDNMGDFSGKALQYVKFELLSVTTASGVQTIETKLGDSVIYTDENFKSDGEIFKFGKSNTSLYKTLYKNVSESAVILTEGSFGLKSVKAYMNTGNQLVIRATAYDYCYGTGVSDTQIYSSNNIIPVENDIELEAKDTLPSIPTDFTMNVINKSQALDGIKKYISGSAISSGYFSNINNAKSVSSLDNIPNWNIVYSNTNVGVKFSGHYSMLDYASAVRYTVYKTYSEENYQQSATNSDLITYSSIYTEMVTSSGAIAKKNDEWPAWTFFYDVEDKDTGLSISRGDTYYVLVEYQLSGFDNKWFPTEYQGNSGLRDSDDPYVYCAYELNSAKQVPAVHLAEKNGYKTSDGAINASYYLSYDDIDGALLLSETKTIEGTTAAITAPAFFIAEDQYQPSCSTETDLVITSIAEWTGQSVSEGYKPEYVVSGVALASGEELYAKYCKYSDPTSAASYSAIQLVSGKNIIKKYTSDMIVVTTGSSLYTTLAGILTSQGIDITIEYPNDVSISSNGNNFVFKMLVAADSADCIGNVKLTVERYEDDAKTIVDTASAISFNITERTVNTLATISTSSSSINVYSIAVEKPVSELSEYITASALHCTMDVNYDSGNFGLDYVKEPHYLLQKSSTDEYYVNNKFNDSIVNTSPSAINTLLSFNVERSNDGLRQSYVIMQGYDKRISYGDTSVGYSDPIGLYYIPREIKTVSAESKVGLGSILPLVGGTITPGISVAKFDLTIGPDNTLGWDLSSGPAVNFEVIITPQNSSTTAVFTTYCAITPQSAEQLSFYAEGLSPGAIYNVELKAYMQSGQWWSITGDRLGNGLSSFTTLKQMNVSMNSITFTADNTGRDDKFVNVKAKSGSVMLKDIENSIDSVTFIFKKGSETLFNTTFSKSSMAAIFTTENPDVTTAGTIGFDFDSSWAPAVNHIMDGNTGYSVQAVVSYNGISTSSSIALNSTPSSWQGKGSYQIIRSTIKGEAGSNTYSMTATVTATDPRRIFYVTGGAVTSELTLYKVVDSTSKVAISTASISLPYDDTDGSVTAVQYTFTGLNANDSYYVSSTMLADFNNDGLFKDEYKQTNSTGYTSYEVVSGTTKVPGGGSATIVHISLSPSASNPVATIYGTNLGSPQKLVYRLYIGGESQDTQETHEFTDLFNNGKVYYSADGSVNCYTLKIPSMTDTSMNYVLELELYANNGDDAPCAQWTGTYTAPTANTLQMTASSLLNKLLGSN